MSATPLTVPLTLLELSLLSQESRGYRSDFDVCLATALWKRTFAEADGGRFVGRILKHTGTGIADQVGFQILLARLSSVYLRFSPFFSLST
jgi:hypothetical protein